MRSELQQVPVGQSRADLYLLALARNMRDQDIVHIGASQLEVWQAAEVARLLWAPNLRVVAAGSYHLGRGRPINQAFMRSRTYGRDLVADRDASMLQTTIFNDLRRGRVVFSGAMQVDMRGNGNLIGFENNGRYVRGPGSAGLPTLTSFSDRFFFALPRHLPTILVPQAHRISVLGDPAARARLGFNPHALQEVITPLASFRADEAGLRLAELAPGVTLQNVQDQTGFQIEADAALGERRPATDEERSALEYVRGATTLRRFNER